MDGRKYGHTLESIDYSECGSEEVTARFANGVSTTGTLLVGADGPRSAVRSSIFGTEKATPTPLVDVAHVNITY